jgi:hypothetical protein
LLRNHCTIAAKSLLSRCEITAQLPQSIHNRYEIATKSVRTQSPRERYEIAAQSHHDRYKMLKNW